MDEGISASGDTLAMVVGTHPAHGARRERDRTRPPVYRRTAVARRSGTVTLMLDDLSVVAVRPTPITGTEPRVHTVVCADALESRAVFDAWLGTGDADATFARLGEVERTAGSVIAAVEVATRAGATPSAVLLHENLPNGLARARGEGALHVARTLNARYGPGAPPCVLVTARAHPPEIHRFRLAGGAHAIDCGTLTLTDRRTLLAGVLRGERWNHTPPRVAFTARDLDLLPFLEADVSVNEIARSLGLTDTQVHDGRRGLHKRLVDAGCVDFVLSGHTTALAAAALRAGAIWEPLAT